MLDLLIRGAPRRRRHRRARVRRRRRRARRPHRRRRLRSTSRRDRTVDADGLVLAPGFIDIHTHYDVQALWDPALTPSPLHGVTTVIGGNCGFSIAPLVPDARRLRDADDGAGRGHAARRRSRPVPRGTGSRSASGSTRLDGRLAVNAGFHVGPLDHAAGRHGRRRHARRRPPPSRSRRWSQLLHESLARRRARLLVVARRGPHRRRRRAGAVTRRATRRVPRPRRARCATTPAPASSSSPAMGEISDERIELMTDMSLAADRPLNWNLLGSASPTPVYEQQLTSSDHAAAHGAHVVALALPDVMRMRSSRMLQAMPGWGEVIALPDAERRAALSPIPRCASGCATGLDAARTQGVAGMMQWDLVELPDGRSVASRRRRAGHRRGRRAARRRPPRAAAAHDRVPVAGPADGRHRRELGGAGRGVARRARRARRLRRRRAPRHHVPRQLPVGRARRAGARARPVHARGGRAPDDRACPPSCSACATAASSPRARTPTWWCSIPRPSPASRPRNATTCPVARCASTPSAVGDRAGDRGRRDHRGARWSDRRAARYVAPIGCRHRHRHRSREPLRGSTCLTLEESRSSPAPAGASARPSPCTSPARGTTSRWRPAPSTRARRASTRRRSSGPTPRRCPGSLDSTAALVEAEGRQAMSVFLDITDRTTLRVVGHAGARAVGPHRRAGQQRPLHRPRPHGPHPRHAGRRCSTSTSRAT